MSRPSKLTGPYRMTRDVPAHLASWQLPPEWKWGSDGVQTDYRHYQEIVDAFGRSLSLVTAADPTHALWLRSEAELLAHLSHPSIPTTFHYWAWYRESRRGPGYLRRWIAGERIGAKVARTGAEDVQYALMVLRSIGSALAYLHDSGHVHGAVSPEMVWAEPTGRFWLLGWHWGVPKEQVPPGLTPPRRRSATPPEWGHDRWRPTPASDQWQLASIIFLILGAELPPSVDIPPVRWIRPDCPVGVAEAIDRALQPRPEERHGSIGTLLRAIDRAVTGRTLIVSAHGGPTPVVAEDAGPLDVEEAKLRWATEDDYEVLSALGSGSFGSVWRVRDLALGREVALKMLHPAVASDDKAMAAFRREARLAAQLAHPAIVPVYDWDSRGDVSWFTMELAEGGSVADLVARSGSRPLEEIAPQVDGVLDGLVAAHSIGIVHRDLKPENILIDRYRRWRVSDFGIANRPGEDYAGPTGTPAFAAPEQLLAEPQGPPVDLFAMAAIVYFVLTGRTPFPGTDGKTILAHQLSGRLDLGGLPPTVAEWIQRGLAPNPDERYADAAAMRFAWRQAVDAAMRPARSTPWWRRWISLGSTPDHPGGRLLPSSE